jgi:Fe-S-cluster containining protein
MLITEAIVNGAYHFYLTFARGRRRGGFRHRAAQNAVSQFVFSLILPVMPVFLECQRCTACCRWPGQVRLSDEEITRLAAFLGLDEFAFIQRFTRVRPDRRGLALLDQTDGACIFLTDGNCAVQPVKPQQCRNFPNLWNFPGFEKVCHAIPRVVDDAEYARRLAEIRRTGATPST